jgi:hypothetical protein
LQDKAGYFYEKNNFGTIIGKMVLPNKSEASFIPKSGHHTARWGSFWNVVSKKV